MNHCVTGQYSLPQHLCVPGNQQSVSVWGVKCIPVPKETLVQGAVWWFQGFRLSEWVKLVLGLEASGMFISRGGGRKGKGTLNKGAGRGLESVGAQATVGIRQRGTGFSLAPPCAHFLPTQ